MPFSVVRKFLICGSLLLLSTAANALPVTWTLGADFAPAAGGIGGTFTYDADTNTTLSWDINVLIHPQLIQVQGPCPNCFLGGVSSGGTSLQLTDCGSQTCSTLVLDFATPLTDAGGVLDLIPGSGGSSGPGTFSIGDGSAYYFYVVSAGNNGVFSPITSGTVSAAPEPGYGVCVAVLLLTLAGMARAKKLGATTHTA